MGLFGDLFGNGSPVYSKPMSDSGLGRSQPPSSNSGRITFNNGIYNGMADSNLRYHVINDLYGTLSDHSTRSAVADLFYESRGGQGVTKAEIRQGLKRLVDEDKMTDTQRWAVIGKYDL